VALAIGLASALAACGGGGDSAPPKPQPVSYQHIISYGQSLSLGGASWNAYPTDQSIPAEDPSVGLMFVSGVLPRGSMAAFTPFQDTSTEPLDESSWGIGAWGTTPLYGALLKVKDMPGVRIGSAAGRGATGIGGLSKGTPPYARLLAQVAAGKVLVKAPDTYSVPVIFWMQGEADRGALADWYEPLFLQLTKDLDADVRAITGQAAPVQILICLPATAPTIADGQRLAAAASPNVHVACDETPYPKTSEGVHLTAQGELMAGYAFGEAMRPYLR